MSSNKRRQGFSLIELVVVVSILAVLAGALIPRVAERMARARDARRLADVQSIKAAIESYYLDRGEFPTPQTNASFGGWDVSHDGSFVSDLRDQGYLSEDAVDPVNDDTYHYRYYVYKQGAYGCNGETDYFVLGVRNFETADFSKEHKGFFKCSGRNWANEFAYVTGGGATWKE